MKKTIYWLTFPITCPLVILFATIELFVHEGEMLLHKWEGWCMGYFKRGYKLSDSGLWIKEYTK